jgi:hypothetical protein
MIKHNQQGAINILIVPLLLLFFFFVGAAGFGYWAYGQSQHYKKDSDAISAAAAEKAVAAEDIKS